MPKKPITFTLPDELIQQVKIAAVIENKTFSGITEELLRQYLELRKKIKNRKK